MCVCVCVCVIVGGATGSGITGKKMGPRRSRSMCSLIKFATVTGLPVRYSLSSSPSQTASSSSRLRVGLRLFRSSSILLSAFLFKLVQVNRGPRLGGTQDHHDGTAIAEPVCPSCRLQLLLVVPAVLRTGLSAAASGPMRPGLKGLGRVHLS